MYDGVTHPGLPIMHTAARNEPSAASSSLVGLDSYPATFIMQVLEEDALERTHPIGLGETQLWSRPGRYRIVGVFGLPTKTEVVAGIYSRGVPRKKTRVQEARLYLAVATLHLLVGRKTS